MNNFFLSVNWLWYDLRTFCYNLFLSVYWFYCLSWSVLFHVFNCRWILFQFFSEFKDGHKKSTIYLYSNLESVISHLFYWHIPEWLPKFQLKWQSLHSSSPYSDPRGALPFQCHPTQGRRRPRGNQSGKRQWSSLIDCAGHMARAPLGRKQIKFNCHQLHGKLASAHYMTEPKSKVVLAPQPEHLTSALHDDYLRS